MLERIIHRGLYRYLDAGSLLLHTVLTVPLLAAIVWLVLPAFGIHPGLNYFQPGWDAFRNMLAKPAIIHSLTVSFSMAAFATLGSLVFALLIIVHLTPARLVTVCRPWLAFLLALPHLTVLLGIQFLISPSGLISRLLAPALDWALPPSVQTVPDAWNLGYIAVVMIKETGFVLMLVIAQLDHLPVSRYYKLGKSFGYSLPYIWLKILLPLIYPKIRLGLWVLFVFAATNVELALFASPNSSPPFSVRIWQWFTDVNLDTQFIASAAALLFFVLVAISLIFFALCEAGVRLLGQSWIINCKRGIERTEAASITPWYILLALHILPFFIMLVWSVSQRWTFPDIVPEGFMLAFWFQTDILEAFIDSILTGIMVASLATVCVIAFGELSWRPIQKWQIWAFYAPLIIPQIGLVFGIYILIVLLNINGTRAGVIAAQLLFVLPYSFIVLGNVWKSYDKRYSIIASALGRHYFSVLFRIKLPLLLRPVLFTWALALAISFNLYLPVLYAGEGRVVTLITELVSLSSNYDRRLIGVLTSWMALFPMIAFAIASALPGLLYGRYRLER